DDNPPDGGPVVEGGEASDVAAETEAGPCPALVGTDACQSVPHFTAKEQIVDGAGDEFCDIPAMVFDMAHCGTTDVAVPPALPEIASLRIAWSDDAFHLHLHVTDPSVIVNPESSLLWDADALEIFIAGTGTLHGPYNGSNDGGAIQIVLSPPAQ